MLMNKKSHTKIKTRFILFFVLLLAATLNINAQTTYYVSNSGSDNNNGTSSSNPIKTIYKVNSLDLQPGDKVLFRRGDSWIGSSLNLKASNSTSERITISNYGDSQSSKPIISMIHDLNNWNSTGSWSYQGSNIWSIPINYAIGLNRLFINGKEAIKAESKSVLNSKSNWYGSADYLYIYSSTNPASAFNSIKVPYNNYNKYTLTVEGNNFTISGLDFRGGIDCIVLTNANNFIIENSNIGWGTTRYGMRTSSVTGTVSDNGIIRNNTFDSGFRIKYTYRVHFLSGSDGLSLANGANYWEVYDNKFANWYHGNMALISTTSATVNHNKVYNNVFSGKDVSYSRAFSTVGYDKGTCSYNKIYNNLIENMPTRSQIGGTFNEIYYNIIDSSKIWDARPTVATGFSLEGQNSENNKIFNNTIFSTDIYAIVVQAPHSSVFNNLIINSDADGSYGIYVNGSNRGNTISNNIIAENNLSSTDLTLIYDGYGYDVTSLESIDHGSDIVQNNYQTDLSDLVIDPVSDNFNLTSTSIAIDAGTNNNLTTDYNSNNIVNTPDIGALEYNTTTDDETNTGSDDSSSNSSDATKLSVANVYASATTNLDTDPSYTIDGKGAYDGDPYSRWSAQPTPQWIVYDLGKVQMLTESNVSYYKFDEGRVYDYSIEISKDEVNWNTIVQHGSSASTEFTVDEIDTLDARYIKVILHGSNYSDWATIWESEFYGYDSTSTTEPTPEPRSNWIASLNITDNSNKELKLDFGQNEIATDQIDSDLNEELLPPAAPDMYAFDVRFLFTDGISHSYKDIRDLAETSVTWEMDLQGTAPFVINWDKNQLPSDSFKLTDTFGGDLVNVDLHKSDSVVIDYQISKLQIVMGSQTANELSLSKGWNEIDNPVSMSVEEITTEPANILETPFYYADGKYTVVDSLKAGRKYWVKTSTNGKLVYQKSNNAASNLAVKAEENWGKLIITDKIGNSTTLYVSEDETSQGFDLPPVPQQGFFDIRFTNNKIVKTNNEAGADLRISYANYPVKIKAEGVNIKIKDKINGSYTNEEVKDGSEITIDKEFLNLFEVETDFVPQKFSLKQNYPNPFNPSTTIEFNLPVSSKVTLNIYNILGEKVATLVNKNLNSGTHKYNFNASNLSSGIYIYSLKSKDFSQVKKMTLLK